jgi:hypothetical protein
MEKNLNQYPEHSDLELLSQVEQVVKSADSRLRSEMQIENDAQVLENIRYETAHASWLDRIPDSQTIVTVATSHPECESVSGTLTLANASCLVLVTGAARYLLVNSHLVWLTGLRSKAQVAKHSPLDPFALQLVLQDLQDQQNFDTWYLNGGKTLAGKLIRLFSDSVELEVASNLITLKLDQVVAVRSPF